MTTDSSKRDVALVVDDSPETLRLLTDALDGNIAELIDQAVTHEQSQKLNESSDGEATH